MSITKFGSRKDSNLRKVWNASTDVVVDAAEVVGNTTKMLNLGSQLAIESLNQMLIESRFDSMLDRSELITELRNQGFTDAAIIKVIQSVLPEFEAADMPTNTP